MNRKLRIACWVVLLLATSGSWWLFLTEDGPLGGHRDLGLLLAIFMTTQLVFWTCGLLLVRTRIGLFRVSAVAFSIYAGWLVVEVGCYWVDPWKRNPFYDGVGGEAQVLDSAIRFKRPPGIYWKGKCIGDMGDGDPYAQTVEFRTDSRGFRNPTELAQADMVFLGDSFTEAGNVCDEDTFAQQVGRMMGLPVANIAVAGWGPPDQKVALEQYGISLKPRYVVWQLFVGNDLSDVMSYLFWIEGQMDLSPYSAWTRRAQRLGRTSPLVQSYRQWKQAYAVRPMNGRFPLADGSSVEMRFRNLPDDQIDPWYFPVRWETMKESIDAVRELCLQHNAKLLAVFIPIKLRIMGGATVDPTGRFNFQGVSSYSEFGFLARKHCEQRRIAFLDATETLRSRAGEGEMVFLPFDSHLSPQGHRRLAEAIVEKLRAAD